MDRTRLRRKPSRGNHDRAVIDAIVDEALVCHFAFVSPHGPIAIPTAHVRVGDNIYAHGSAVNAMLTTLATGIDACATITLIDGLVLARTAFHHSMNYRSVIAFGRAREVSGDEKVMALDALVEKIEAGRSRESRRANGKELLATCVIAMPLTEASAKIRTGPPLPDDNDEDRALPYWSGVIPIVTKRGERIPAR